MPRLSRRVTGRLAELVAGALVWSAGYRVIARNFAVRAGEIDLIAQKRSQLVFIEVRLRRRSRFAGALQSVDAAKQQRIARTAQAFLTKHPSYNHHQLRFDVVTFEHGNYAPHLRPTMRWVQNAFTPPDF